MMRVSIALIVCMTIAVGVIAQAWAARRRGASGTDGRRLEALEQRLARIENAVETVAVEIERISEGQRFTTRLLKERGQAVSERSR